MRTLFLIITIIGLMSFHLDGNIVIWQEAPSPDDYSEPYNPTYQESWNYPVPPQYLRRPHPPYPRRPMPGLPYYPRPYYSRPHYLRPRIQPSFNLPSQPEEPQKIESSGKQSPGGARVYKAPERRKPLPPPGQGEVVPEVPSTDSLQHTPEFEKQFGQDGGDQ